MAIKRYLKSSLYFIFGFLCIIAFIIASILNWKWLFNLNSFYWLYFIFFTIFLFSGIYFVIEGIYFTKAAHNNKCIDSFLYNKIITIFLIIMVIGGFLFYFSYLNNKQGDHGPYLSWKGDTATTMTITWDTQCAEPDPVFKWGEKEFEVTQIATVTGTEHHHTVTLTELKPDSTYYYQIPGFLDKITSFRTGPNIGSQEPFTFLLYGDTREDNPSESELDHEELIELMEEEKDARFVLQAGDIANDYADNWKEQWDYNFHVISPISKHIPYMTVAGNHDWWKEGSIPESGQTYINFYELPDNGPNGDKTSYYFSYANVFILVIGYDYQDAASPENYDEDHVKWVKDQLNDAKSSDLFDWIIVMHHKPAFSLKITSGEDETGEPENRYWHPIFMELGVDFVLSGHNHHYERIPMGFTSEDIGTHNITYIISGAGGGGGELHDTAITTFDSQLEPVGDLEYYGKTAFAEKEFHYVRFYVEGTKLILTTIDIEGTVIDTFTYIK